MGADPDAGRAGNTQDSTAIYVRRHLRVGWRALFVFATLGLILESLQGFKIAAYLDRKSTRLNSSH